MLKYKIIYKIQKGKKIVAYKLYLGVYVFMVSPKLLEKGLKAGIIEQNNNIATYDYEEMCNMRGKTAEYRLDYALKHSNLDYLKNSLLEVSKMNDVLSFDYLYMDELLFSVSCNIKTNELLSYKLNDNLYKGLVFNSTYDVINYLIYHTDRDYMNSRNIVQKVKENKGREESLGPYLNRNWVRFEEDKHLSFSDICYDFEVINNEK